MNAVTKEFLGEYFGMIQSKEEDLSPAIQEQGSKAKGCP